MLRLHCLCSTAQNLRDEARAKCAAGEWESCLAKLDEARSVDPAGDFLPGVQTEREQATKGLNEQRRQREPLVPDAGKSLKDEKGPAPPH
jgi:hypothetical protein